MKRTKAITTVSLYVCALLLMLPLASCAGGSNNASATTEVSSTQAATETGAESEKLLPDLPDTDFGGQEIVFLSRVIDNADWVDWVPRDIYAEKETGELINDAVYARNTYIEDKYNFKIREIKSTNFNSDMQKAIKAGDPIYDVVLPGTMDAGTFSQQGLFVDLMSVGSMDLEKPWWNQKAIKDLTIGGRLFFVQGDMIILDNDGTEAMIFNKKLIQDYNLDNPYTLVKEGKWTIDKIIEMKKTVAEDLNNDGAMGPDDKFGLVCQLDSFTSFINGCGVKIASKDDSDYPILTFANDQMYNVVDKVMEMMYDKETVINLHHYENKFPVYAYQTNMFSENKALFSWIRMRVVETLRAMEADFGILPLPKYDEAQKEYHTSVNVYTACVIAIPMSCSDTERAGFALEALSAESRYTLEPAYYDVALHGKYARDDESKEMLDIIFGSTVYDIMTVYNFGSFGWDFVNLPRTNNPNYVSLYEKSEAKVIKAIDKCIEQFMALD